MAELSIIVRYCNSIRIIKEFYEIFGIEFQIEDHNGVVHYSAKFGDVIFELYPRPKDQSDINTGINSMFGIKVDNIELIKNELTQNRQVFSGNNNVIKVRDPEGGILLVEQNGKI